jgi:hypothetical protein
MQTMDIIYACVILNDMIIENEARSNLEVLFEVGQATKMKKVFDFSKIE